MDPSIRGNRTDLYESFQQYMIQLGRKPFSSGTLHKSLMERGVAPSANPLVTSSGKRYWPGLNLTTEVKVANALQHNHAEHNTEIPAERAKLVTEIEQAITAERAPMLAAEKTASQEKASARKVSNALARERAVRAAKSATERAELKAEIRREILAENRLPTDENPF